MTLVGAVWIDGEARAPAEAQVSVFDRGFLYGDSVFEALRTYGGKPFALDEHMQRLARSASRVLIPMPLDPAAFADEVRTAIAQTGLGESYLRILLTRGSGRALGLDPALAQGPRRVIFVLPLSVPSDSLYEEGIAAVTYRTRRVVDGTSAEGAKVGNYLVSVLAVREAQSRGADEALFVDPLERVLEGATSNVFGVSGNVLVTPPEELGILAGITRAHLLSLAPSLGLQVEVRAIHVGELRGFDELFISSSIRELLPVVRVDEARVGDGRPGPVAARLLAAFRRRAAESAR